MWIIPEDNETTFIVSDYAGYLDGVKNIHEILQESMDIEYQKLQEGKISTEEFTEITEVTSSQVTTQISEFITSKPPQEWQDSYINYMEAMKKFNEYISETKVLANQIENKSPESEMNETKEKINKIKNEISEFIELSDISRPE